MNILDSSAVLATIFREPGAKCIETICQKAFKNKESVFIHQANFIEVIYKIAKEFSEEDSCRVLSRFEGPWWGKVNYMDNDLGLIAADLKKKYPFLSLGDSIGMGWTKLTKGTFWTTDKILKEVGEKEKIDVRLIR